MSKKKKKSTENSQSQIIINKDGGRKEKVKDVTPTDQYNRDTKLLLGSDSTPLIRSASIERAMSFRKGICKFIKILEKYLSDINSIIDNTQSNLQLLEVYAREVIQKSRHAHLIVFLKGYNNLSPNDYIYVNLALEDLPKYADFDKNVVGMVEYFNRCGLTTHLSCQGHSDPHTSMFWISFADNVTERDIVEFQWNHIIANVNPDAFTSCGRFANRIVIDSEKTPIIHEWCYFAANAEAAYTDLKAWQEKDYSDLNNMISEYGRVRHSIMPQFTYAPTFYKKREVLKSKLYHMLSILTQMRTIIDRLYCID